MDTSHWSQHILQYLNQYPFSRAIFQPHIFLTLMYSPTISHFLFESLGICCKRYSSTSLHKSIIITTSLYITFDARPHFFHGKPWPGNIPPPEKGFWQTSLFPWKTLARQYSPTREGFLLNQKKNSSFLASVIS